MTTSAELELSTVTVAAGDEASTTLTVRNDSDIVEAYDLTVQGPCTGWSTVEPERLSLYPGTSETVTVRVHPPRSPDVPAGELPLGVRVLPAERPELVVVPETTVHLLPFGELAAHLRPQRRRGWRRARYRVELTNMGNVPVLLRARAEDPAEELRFRFTPPRVRLDPGAETDVRLRTTMPGLIWFGRPVSRTFLVTVAPNTDPAVEASEVDEQFTAELSGEAVQLPLLPRWLLALLALLLALLLLWFTLVRPAVQSAARQAAENSTRDAVRSGEVAPGPAARRNGEAPPGGGSGAQGGNTPNGGGGGGTGGGGAARGGQQSSQTVTVLTRGGARNVGSYVVPRGRVFLITDLVLANYQGDSGLLTVSFGRRQLTTIALETFRNQDYHWVTPIEVPAGGSVRAAVSCSRPGAPAVGPRASRCAQVLNVSGTLRSR